MTRLLLTIGLWGFVMVENPASASSRGADWVKKSTVYESASSEAEFLSLQNKYPDIFGSFSHQGPEPITSVSMELTTFEYVGKEPICGKHHPPVTRDVMKLELCSRDQCINTLGGRDFLNDLSMLNCSGRNVADPDSLEDGKWKKCLKDGLCENVY